MGNTETVKIERIESILHNTETKPDVSEYDFLTNYQNNVQISADLGEDPEELPSFSEYVEKTMQRFSIPTELGKRIRLERRKLGLTALQFANICGISRYTLSNIENEKHPPTLNSLIQIADVLGLPLDELIGRTVNTQQRDHIIEVRNDVERRKHPEYIKQVLRERKGWKFQGDEETEYLKRMQKLFGTPNDNKRDNLGKNQVEQIE